VQTSGKPAGPNAISQYPLSKKLFGPNSRAERFAEKKFLSPPEFRLSCPAAENEDIYTKP